ncbi:MAG: excisionase family DNA-binding protein [Propionibacteriaceae bacterium]|nr:excisionase family DNA-binding protein [Propionibacteriaceae bacterium]
MADVQDCWLSVEEIGQYLGMSGNIVYRWGDRSAMPARKMGRKREFKRDQVDAWVKTGDSREEAPEGGVK